MIDEIGKQVSKEHWSFMCEICLARIVKVTAFWYPLMRFLIREARVYDRFIKDK